MDNRIRFTAILTVLLLYPVLSYSKSKVSFTTDLRGGFSYFNAAGLNKITEGLNAGYGTDFGKIRMPVAVLGGFAVGIYNSQIGFELGYEFAGRSSYSSIYNVTENIKYSAMPLGIKYGYTFYKTRRWSYTASCSAGIMWTWFSMETRPDVTGVNSSYEAGATAWYVSPSFEVLYLFADNVGISALLGGRYASTSKFKYSSSDSRHNEGDFVTFSDGSSLTMNISGLKFLVGITLTWR